MTLILNPKNIYLDQDFSAKLSDFMFCMALPEGKTQVEDHIMGSHGYIALELRNGVYSEKSDVFGFGSLLQDLLTGMRYVFRNHTMNEIVDPTILAEAEAVGGGEGVHQHQHRQFQAVLELILRCLSYNADERPIMLDVAKQLKRIQKYYRP